MSQIKKSEAIKMLQCNGANVEPIQVGKYRGTRYWAVWINNELLAVTVYKKGALAIKEAMRTKLAEENSPG